MNRMRLQLFAMSAAAGVVASLAPPGEWFVYLFLSACGLTILLGIAVAVDSKDERPLNAGDQALSFFFLGTERPQAIAPNGKMLVAFQCLAIGSACMAIGAVIHMAF